MDFLRLSRIWVSKLKHPKRQPAAPVENFAPIKLFMEFHRFAVISEIFIDFDGFFYEFGVIKF